MRISDWSSDVCSSDLLASQIEKIAFLKELGAESLNLGISALYLKSLARQMLYRKPATLRRMRSERKHLEIACFLRLLLLRLTDIGLGMIDYRIADLWRQARWRAEDALAEELRSEEHTSELQSLMRISYAVFCLKKKKNKAY